ncbi:Fe-S type, tartrate/fumarate subfamily hydro-lyase subunit beta [Candidatus Scalindua japonica]|uniref:Fe-S type, tartrate/fumarate subfamily hydro-lyase subunit beta n=1 Tax=Candidatus Scalindua japonica TaxID=1284222 RepID=A0A286TWP0_9BACT|nr:Fe-S-containing hydro-lyase [Candidatus Scalindua japonica]GAX60298.1 Fe-S type, tartrate/fumarate subfamily hydro-lyase subunit beta [Candidatus Scalindua japonica]
MTEYINLKTPLNDSTIEKLKAGDKVRISGVLYTGRDAAHKRLMEMIETGKKLPFNIEGQLLYYVGPTPAKPGQIIGSAGPTTSYRMDTYAPTLIKMGLKGTIGKGGRSEEVKEAMKMHKAVYFAAVGGAAALIAKTIKSVEIIAFEDLGTEAIRKMQVENFPAIVVNDTKGNDLYNIGREKYNKPNV